MSTDGQAYVSFNWFLVSDFLISFVTVLRECGMLPSPLIYKGALGQPDIYRVLPLKSINNTLLVELALNQLELLVPSMPHCFHSFVVPLKA